MRILVCGGRDYDDYGMVKTVLGHWKPTEIVEGGANGADNLAAMYAIANELPHLQYKADWKTHGRAAGMIRNKHMLENSKPDMVIAFPGGRGTTDMVTRAIEAGIPTEIIE